MSARIPLLLLASLSAAASLAGPLATGTAVASPAAPAERPTVVAAPARAAPIARAAAQAPLERARLAVAIDRAKVIRLPEATRTVIVGNPAIADVAVQKNGIVVVTGRSFGETNLIALDGAGGMLAESMLTVQGGSDAIVTVQRGLDRQSYSCTPACMPAVQLGDSAGFFAGTKDQAIQHGQFSSQRP